MRALQALLVSCGLLWATAGPAMADRPVTEAERAKLTRALASQGCSGGQLEWDEDDGHFEVDDARCKDGQTYDLKFNKDFTLRSKKLDH